METIEYKIGHALFEVRFIYYDVAKHPYERLSPVALAERVDYEKSLLQYHLYRWSETLDTARQEIILSVLRMADAFLHDCDQQDHRKYAYIVLKYAPLLRM